MPKRRIFYKGLSVYCGGPHGEIKQSHESQQDQETAHDTGLYAAEKCAQMDRKLEYPPIAIV